jgi:type IV pilus assembly protein PilX
MKSLSLRKRQHGVALVVALLFLLVVTVISLIAASNSSMGLKMSSNMADASVSFQSAEAGAIAVLAMAKDDANDPFRGEDNADPFENFAIDDEDHPLSNLNDGPDPEIMDVDIFMTNAATTCPRSPEGSSVGLLDCDYYRIESEHDVSKKARTKVTMGAVKTIIGSGGT